MTKQQRAERLVEITSWIKTAEEGLKEFTTRTPSVEIGTSRGWCSTDRIWGIQPGDLPSGTGEARMVKYYTRVVKDEIREAKKERQRLLRKM
jgi:hypothetical protein